MKPQAEIWNHRRTLESTRGPMLMKPRTPYRLSKVKSLEKYKIPGWNLKSRTNSGIHKGSDTRELNLVPFRLSNLKSREKYKIPGWNLRSRANCGIHKGSDTRELNLVCRRLSSLKSREKYEIPGWNQGWTLQSTRGLTLVKSHTPYRLSKLKSQEKYKTLVSRNQTKEIPSWNPKSQTNLHVHKH